MREDDKLMFSFKGPNGKAKFNDMKFGFQEGVTWHIHKTAVCDALHKCQMTLKL